MDNLNEDQIEFIDSIKQQGVYEDPQDIKALIQYFLNQKLHRQYHDITEEILSIKDSNMQLLQSDKKFKALLQFSAENWNVNFRNEIQEFLEKLNGTSLKTSIHDNSSSGISEVKRRQL